MDSGQESDLLFSFPSSARRAFRRQGSLDDDAAGSLPVLVRLASPWRQGEKNGPRGKRNEYHKLPGVRYLCMTYQNDSTGT